MAGARPKTSNNRHHRSQLTDYELTLCPAYRSLSGCDNTLCDHLHLCRNFILQQCPADDEAVGGEKCSFAHDLKSAQSRALFKRRFGTSPPEGEALHEFKKLFGATIRVFLDYKPTEEEQQCNQEKLKIFLQNLSDTPSASPPVVTCHSAKDPEICEFHLHGICQSTETSHLQKYRHCSGPFQWEIRDGTRPLWMPLSQECNCRVEKHYCDVANRQFTGNITASCRKEDHFFSKVTIEFDTDPFTVSDESGQTLHVRRLSTASHVQAGESTWQKGYRAQWTWYWQDSHMNWIRYPEEESDGDFKSFLTSSTEIERNYLRFRDESRPRASQLIVNTELGRWQLNFPCMEQTKLEMRRPVARRPMWRQPLKQHSNDEHSFSASRQQKAYVYVPAKEPQRGARVLDVTGKRVQAPHFLKPAAKVPRGSEQPATPNSSSTEVPALPSSSVSSCATDESRTIQSPDQKESLSICPHFLRGSCKKNDDKYSHKRHFLNPYQWQFMDTTSRGADWEDFPQDANDNTEKSYCDVTKSSCFKYTTYEVLVSKLTINRSVSATTLYERFLLNLEKQCISLICVLVADVSYFSSTFDTLTGLIPDTHIRRLSTSSSVLKSSWKKAFCVEWIWYWQDERGIWTVYSEQNAQGTQAGVESATIEQKYQEFLHEQGESVVEFTAGRHRYKLDFTIMKQSNVHFRTSRRVLRRPKFVSMEERRRMSREISESKRVSIAVPTTWDNLGTQRDVKLVPLTDDFIQEYISIGDLLWGTMEAKTTIVSIERIQNLELWEDFTKMSERMKNKNGGKPVLQKRIFHGTTGRSYADAICRQNFDWRLCGTNVGTKYGRGSYFARDANLAHKYTVADNHNHRYILVAQVLIGTFTTGNSEFTRPPPKDPSKPHGDIYDSCVNDVANPKVFVIFEKDQMYPEYLIKYKV